jgi:IS1 family transposase
MRDMNKLPLETRVRILNLLIEGSSLRSISRVCDVSINTVTKLLVDAGRVCAAFHDEKVQGVKAKRVQCDEIWSFTYSKQKNVAKAKAAPAYAGDTWTWTAIEAESKLIVSYTVGGRDSEYAMAFIGDLQSRLANRVQLTTDGHKAYLDAVEDAFGADVDYAQLVKLFGASPESIKGRYNRAECTGIKKIRIERTPDPAPKHISTSFVERHNLNMRMQMRRFSRLTTGYSKKIENYEHMVALYIVWYNWIRTHEAHRMTPAMAVGLTDKLVEMTEIARLIDDAEMRATIQKRVAALAPPQLNRDTANGRASWP